MASSSSIGHPKQFHWLHKAALLLTQCSPGCGADPVPLVRLQHGWDHIPGSLCTHRIPEGQGTELAAREVTSSCWDSSSCCTHHWHGILTISHGVSPVPLHTPLHSCSGFAPSLQAACGPVPLGEAFPLSPLGLMPQGMALPCSGAAGACRVLQGMKHPGGTLHPQVPKPPGRH